MINIVEAEAGEKISGFVYRLKELSYEEGGKSVRGIFNEIELDVHYNSRIEDIITIYDLKHELRRHGLERYIY